ncbi:unnamed protein product [Kuraishia capsulata CBS 1993]|uniref:Kinesin-like protein n=1 Tax=Kuraishia capsulata CBS 1993 TaxID=1382522 RepID=W6MPY3_9ASCO|nr:uncharacterized protein KUCA_T00003250001 [Kuraishia capsulata CBS 1993]CDK27272.1 unnamed protein product [Kuraishia capsulata CBS 1993]
MADRDGRSLSKISDSAFNTSQNHRPNSGKITKTMSAHQSTSRFQILKHQVVGKTTELTELKKKITTLRTRKYKHDLQREQAQDALERLNDQMTLREEEMANVEENKLMGLKELEADFEDKKLSLVSKQNADLQKKADEYFKLAQDTELQKQESRKAELSHLMGEVESLKNQISNLPLDFQQAINDIVVSGDKNLELVKKEKQSEIMGLNHSIEVTKDLILEANHKLSKVKDEVEISIGRTNTMELEYEELLAQWKLTENSCIDLQHEIDSQMDELKSLEDKIAEVMNNAEMYDANALQMDDQILSLENSRRNLHGLLQDLKGNIRVFCRVRPLKAEENPARIEFAPMNDAFKEQITLVTEQRDSMTGRTPAPKPLKKYDFGFDKVFDESLSNSKVYEEISELVQSALNGFNVCIFAYGQTGSGKTFTMSKKEDGMIPRAIRQIFEEVSHLKQQGWEFEIQGQFLEIYNETINDLIGNTYSDSQKHEIKHDETLMRTSVTGVTKVFLDSPETVNELLAKASKNRFTASTKANDKSSRSHSLYIFEITGHNVNLNESTRGVLNLVDLAGSERFTHSQTTGDRFKETQAINKSLSSLGDVICALGANSSKQHIPYRNSKLTYLLQYSLGGNSKTLMFVNISPAHVHFNETLNSLRFATKVNNTHIGNAKRNA